MVGSIKQECIIPLAISDINDTEVCIAGLNEMGKWIRPVPMFKSDIDSTKEHYFDYHHKMLFKAKISTAIDRRIEDRDIIRDDIKVIEKIEPDTVHKYIIQFMDNKVEGIFEEGRSAGIVSVRLKDLTYGRQFGGSKKVRLKFEDRTGKLFNFIMVENRFKKYILGLLKEEDLLAEETKDNILTELQKKDTYFTITLTKKSTTNFPGPYNGCHPLVSGIHSFK